MRLRRIKDTPDGTESPPKSTSSNTTSYPLESLHMTTRLASRNASNATNSANGSVSSQDSRRNSRAEITAKIGGLDSDSNRPAKMARRSSDARSEDSKNSSQTSDEVIVVRTPLAHPVNGDISPERPSKAESESSAFKDDAASQADAHETQKDIAQTSIEFPLLAQLRKPAVGRRRRRQKRVIAARSVKASASQTPTYGTPADTYGDVSIKNESPGKKDTAAPVKRLPGRRRAPHPDAQIEADLRRQLDLKVAYRLVTKALKPVLAEIAKRTVDQIEEDATLHTKAPEYEIVLQALNARLEARLLWLQHQKDHETKRLERMRVADETAAKMRFTGYVRDIQSNYLLRCKHAYLSKIHQCERDSDSEATEDEDDVIPKLRQADFKTGERRLIDGNGSGGSRSRFFVEMEKEWNRLDVRRSFRKDHLAFDAATVLRKPRGFATFDGQARRNAEAIMNLHCLARAAQGVEEDASKAARVLANEDATGLQALAAASDLAVQATAESEAKPKLGKKALPPLAVTFAPVLTASATTGPGRSGSKPAVAPSPKKRATGRQASASSPEAGQPPHPSLPTNDSIPTPGPITPYGAAPYYFGRTDNRPPSGSVSGPQHSPIRQGGQTSSSMNIGRVLDQPNPAERIAPRYPLATTPGPLSGGPLAPRNESTDGQPRSGRPEPGSIHVFPAASAPPSQAVHPPFPGPYGTNMPPPHYRYPPYPHPESAGSPSPQASPLSPYQPGWPPQGPPDSARRTSGPDWRPYREISSRPSGSASNTPSQDKPLYAPPSESTPGARPPSGGAGKGETRALPLPPPGPPQPLPPHATPYPPYAPSPYGPPRSGPYFPPPFPHGASPPAPYYGGQPPQYGPIGGSPTVPGPPGPPGPPNAYYAGNLRPSLPQYQQSPAFPPMSTHGMPGSGPPPPPPPPPSANRPPGRQNSMGLQQHPGQIGHQIILPASMDPKRHQKNMSPASQPFPVFSQLAASPRPGYGSSDASNDKARNPFQPAPMHYQFESYKPPPKR